MEAFCHLLSTELKTFLLTPAAKRFVAVCYGKVRARRCLLCLQLHLETLAMVTGISLDEGDQYSLDL